AARSRGLLSLARDAHPRLTSYSPRVKAIADDTARWEYDWLASDLDGNFGYFTSAALSSAPATFLAGTSGHLAIKATLDLPTSTTAKYAPHLAPRFENTWRLMAERGLFAYDSDPYRDAYLLVAEPRLPARLRDVPDIARIVAESNRCEFHFRKTKWVDAR